MIFSEKVCLDISYELSAWKGLDLFSLKNKKKKKYFRMSSSAIVIGTIRDNILYNHFLFT